MRCQQCDDLLTDFEATRKDLRDGSYVDLCDLCYSFVEGMFPVKERFDLWEESVPENEPSLSLDERDNEDSM